MSVTSKPSFPEDAWNSRLFAQYRQLVGPTTEAPDPFLWGAFAGAFSFLLGRDARFAWGTGFQVPTLLVALVGTTGKARKSTAIDDVISVIVDPLRARGGDGIPDPTDIVVGSGSGEGFAASLSDKRFTERNGLDGDASRIQTGRRVLFVMHELGALLGKIERGQAGNMLDFLLGCFDARSKWVHRTRGGDDEIQITNGTGVVLAASTASWLVDQLSDVHVMAGFANRFIWLAGDRKQALAFRPAVSEDHQEQLRHSVKRTLQELVGGTFELDPGARVLHESFYALQYAHETDDVLQDAATARTDIVALRLALLLAAGDSTLIVRERHVSAAWQVAQYSCSVVGDIVQRLRVRTLREAEDRVLQAATAVGQTEPGTFSKRDVYQRVKGKTGLDSATFNQLWNSLLAVEAIIAIDPEGRRFKVAP